MRKPELTILMPCLNEIKTLPTCIKKAEHYLKLNKIKGEILVADNGSSDGSQEAARKLKARIVDVKERGYGAALMGGIQAARGKYIIIGDSDASYDFSDLNPFVEKLRAGYDLVIGNRFKGGIKKGAMPFLHRYLGNPILTKIGQILFKVPIGDFHCGLRGFVKNKITELQPFSPGMEFASEMLIKMSLKKNNFCEVPVILSKDGRDRRPHLRTWRDGFRHMKILLIYSPAWLFLYPGIFLISLGLLLGALIMNGPLSLGNIILGVHTLLYSWIFVILGLDLVIFLKLSRRLQEIRGIVQPARAVFLKREYLFELLIISGILFFLLGSIGTFYCFHAWAKIDFSNLDIEKMMRIVVPSATLLVIGIKLFFLSFLFDIIEQNVRAQKL